MENFEIIEDKTLELTFVVKDESHGVCNALRHILMQDPDVEYGESVEDAAIREAKEETSIDVELKELVNVYSKPDRDPRGHTITVAYIAKGDFNSRKADSDAKDIGIFSSDELDEINIAFDHAKIIKDCLKKAKK